MDRVFEDTYKNFPLTNLNKCIYNGKSVIEVNINNISKNCLQNTETIGELITSAWKDTTQHLRKGHGEYLVPTTQNT